MKKKIFIMLIVPIILLILIIGTSLGQASKNGPSTLPASIDPYTYKYARWFLDTIDDTNDVGTNVSISVEPNTGQIFISYYEETDKDLYLAVYDGTSGDCGPGNTWHCHKLLTMGDVGLYNAIDTIPVADGVEFIISYYNATSASLNYIDGFNLNSGFSSHSYQIIAGNKTFLYYYGRHTSVKFDSNGYPHIAFQYYNALNPERQMYAHFVGDGTGNCGVGGVSGQWQCDTVASGEGIGMYASLDIDGSDRPSIAYYDSHNGIPIVASYSGSSWIIRNVSQNTLDTGKNVSLYVEDNGTPHIAYRNVTSETLEYASYVNSGGNCGFSSVSLNWEWQCDWIDDIGDSILPMGLDIAQDANGSPMIAYQSVDDPLAPAALKIARPAGAIGELVGNCGPQSLFYLWYCDYVDGGGSWTDEGGAVSMDTNSAGFPTIAYQEYDSYVNPNQGHLKIAYQRLLTFLPLIVKK